MWVAAAWEGPSRDPPGPLSIRGRAVVDGPCLASTITIDLDHVHRTRMRLHHASMHCAPSLDHRSRTSTPTPPRCTWEAISWGAPRARRRGYPYRRPMHRSSTRARGPAREGTPLALPLPSHASRLTARRGPRGAPPRAGPSLPRGRRVTPVPCTVATVTRLQG